MVDLSRYIFEALHHDEEFILYRGQSKADASQADFASRPRQAPARPDSSDMQSAGYGHDEALAESGYGAPSVLGRLTSGRSRDEVPRTRDVVGFLCFHRCCSIRRRKA